VTDVNGNTEKSVENEPKKLSDDFNKATRQRLRALILAIVGLTVSALSSFSSSRELNALTQFMSLALLMYAFMHALNADTNLISIFHDAALLNLEMGIIVKALESSDEQTSTPSGQPGSTLSNWSARLIMDLDPFPIIFNSYMDSIPIISYSYIIEFTGLFNAVFNLITRVLGLSIQSQPLLTLSL